MFTHQSGVKSTNDPSGEDRGGQWNTSNYKRERKRACQKTYLPVFRMTLILKSEISNLLRTYQLLEQAKVRRGPRTNKGSTKTRHNMALSHNCCYSL